jgi:hypothetical protein
LGNGLDSPARAINFPEVLAYMPPPGALLRAGLLAAAARGRRHGGLRAGFRREAK